MPSSLLFRILVVVTVVCGSLSAQLDLMVATEREGMYALRYEDLLPHGDPAAIDLERLTLKDGDRLVPLAVWGTQNGRLSNASAIYFYHPGPRAGAPVKSYRLTYADFPPRIREVEVVAEGDPVPDVVVTRTFEEDLLWDGWECLNAKGLDGPEAERPQWFWRNVPAKAKKNGPPGPDQTQNFAFHLLPRPKAIDIVPCVIEIRLRSHLAESCPQSIAVAIGGHEIGKAEWTEPGMRTVSLPFPGNLTAEKLVVSITNTSAEPQWDDAGNQVRPKRPNDVLVDSIAIRYPSLLAGPTNAERQLLYEFTADAGSPVRTYRFRAMNAEGFRLYDLSDLRRLRDGHAVVEPGKAARFACVNADGYYAPSAVRPTAKRNLARETEGGDWVVVTVERFAENLRPLVEMRRRQGLKPYVVTDREVYDAFSGGTAEPAAIRRFMAHAAKAWRTKPRWLLLVGDADRAATFVSEKPVLPTMLVKTFYNGATASDFAFIEGIDETIAVGRIPVRRETELAAVIDRMLKYEETPAGGAWRRRLTFVASEGRFGPVIDPIIENAVIRMLEDQIPAAYDLNMTYANPTSKYVYPPERLNAKVIDRFNDGSLMFTYIGHGYKKGFDALRFGTEVYPILNAKDIDRIDAGARNPLMAIIACSTAHFDDPSEDSIAEELLRKKGGPVAIIGSTRISHPFANTLLGKELVAAFFGGDRTLGEVLTVAKSKVADRWSEDPMAAIGSLFVRGLDVGRLMKDHAHLYVLLGDPAVRAARPRGEIVLASADTAAPGAELSVTMEAKGIADGNVELTLECERHVILKPTEKVNIKDKALAERVVANYEAANDKVAVRATAVLAGGKAEAKIVIPADLPAGTYFVKAFSENGTAAALGAKALKVALP